MQLLFLLVAQGQMLPPALQTVSLRIVQMEGERVYVVSSAEQLDASLPVVVRTVKADNVSGKHMERITREIARDPQRVFVIAKTPPMLADVLRRAGIPQMPRYAGR
jgi:hypothetical protein